MKQKPVLVVIAGYRKCTSNGRREIVHPPDAMDPIPKWIGFCFARGDNCRASITFEREASCDSFMNSGVTA